MVYGFQSIVFAFLQKRNHLGIQWAQSFTPFHSKSIKLADSSHSSRRATTNKDGVTPCVTWHREAFPPAGACEAGVHPVPAHPHGVGQAVACSASAAASDAPANAAPCRAPLEG